MTDLHTLHDAFTELERRADAAAPAALPQPRRARGFRLVPMMATMAAVVALAAGAVWLVPNDTAGTRVADQSTSGSPEALADKFRAVLGDTARFEVTKGMEMANGGAMITGTLTAGDVTGGFILAIFDTKSEIECEPPTCTVAVKPGPGGKADASFIVQTYPEATVTTYEAYHALDDDTVLKLTVSNRRIPHDPNSEEFASQPPLTTDQMLAIARSDLW
jgi:hypothetical protein